jgi:branched-chain amino acid transport system ATP-binding protein
VAIARGLMSDPAILIIDELSLGLAPVVVYQLLKTLKRLKEAGLTILLVEQNVHLALALGCPRKLLRGRRSRCFLITATAT